jgi:hypothetical protein
MPQLIAAVSSYFDLRARTRLLLLRRCFIIKDIIGQPKTNDTPVKKLKYHAIIIIALIAGFAVGIGQAGAAPLNTPTPTAGLSEYNALCSALQKVPDTKLYRANCKLWTSQGDQDSAVNNICDKYGGKKLKKECDAYTVQLYKSNVKTTAPNVVTHGQCGEGDGAVKTSINIGCTAKGNPIMDFSFAVIRFLSNGAGLVLIASLVYGGLQYTMSRGDPQATAAALNRIKSVGGALFLFIFAYAILNYLIPGLVLK